MTIDDRQLAELIVESQDLQVDAMRGVADSLPLLEHRREEKRRYGVDPTSQDGFANARRSLLRTFGLGAGGVLASAGLAGTVSSILARPALAQDSGGDVDVQILQTASSLEILAVATYGVALTLPFIKDGNPTVKAFAETTMKQHDEHRAAFQKQTKALDGEEQKNPNPKYAAIVEKQKPTLKTPVDVVNLAAALEQVARDTYLADLALFSDTESKSLMATVMGVETQHLAVLRAVKALIEGGAVDLVKIPTDVAKLPAAAGSVAFDEPNYEPAMASPPEEGALS